MRVPASETYMIKRMADVFRMPTIRRIALDNERKTNRIKKKQIWQSITTTRRGSAAIFDQLINRRQQARQVRATQAVGWRNGLIP